MDFQGHLENVYRMVKDEPLIFILCGVLTHLLVIFSLAFLAGPIMGSYTLMAVYYLRDGRKPAFNDLFSGLSRFGELFPYFFLIWLIIAGFFIFIVPGILFMTWWLYVLVLMADKRLSLGIAMRQSKNKVQELGLSISCHLLFHFLLSSIFWFCPCN